MRIPRVRPKTSRLFAILLAIYFSSRTVIQIIFFDKQECKVYCEMALSYEKFFEQRSFDSYFLQKSGNSLLAYAILQLPRMPTDAQFTISLLLVIGTLQILLSIWLWLLTARAWKLSDGSKFAGLLVLFANPTMSYYHFYFWDNPDSLLLLCAILYALLWRTKSNLLLWLYLFSWFVAPQLRLFILVGIIFHSIKLGHRVSVTKKLDSMISSLKRQSLIRRQGILNLISYLWLFVMTVSIIINYKILIPKGIVLPINFPYLLPISFALSMWFVRKLVGASAIYLLQNLDFYLDQIKRKITVMCFLGVAEAARALLVFIYGAGENRAMTSSLLGIGYTLNNWVFQTLTFPALSVVAHVSTFGPLIIFLGIQMMNSLSGLSQLKDLRAIAPGIFLINPLFIETESRHFIFALPIIICLFLQDFNLDRRKTALFLLMYVVNSRAFVSSQKVDSNESDWFALQMGPWFTSVTYVVSLSYLVICFLIYRVFLQAKSKKID